MKVLDSLMRVPRDEYSTDLMKKYTVKDRDGKPFKLYQEIGGEICFPRSAAKHFNEVEDRRVRGRRVDTPWESVFSPREGQAEVIRDLSNFLVTSPDHGGVLVAGCGKGKTYMGTEIALRTKMPVCIIVHKEFLEEQWAVAIERLSPGRKVGRLRRDQWDTGNDYDLVCASVQSLTNPKREYPREFFESFGVMIFDEIHRYGADVWQRVFGLFPALYRIGLTATPGRYDGLWRVVTDHVGETGATLHADPLESKVFMVSVTSNLSEEDWDLPWLDDKMKRGKMITAIANHDGRNKMLARNILKAHAANRITLVISERRKQLEILEKMLVDLGVSEEAFGYYVGSRKMKQLEEAAKKPLIMATYAMAKEGLDIEVLDTLVMATPQYSITQTVGRLFRELSGKAMPVVLDFVDVNIEKLRGQAFGRVRQYREMQCIIEGEF